MFGASPGKITHSLASSTNAECTQRLKKRMLASPVKLRLGEDVGAHHLDSNKWLVALYPGVVS